MDRRPRKSSIETDMVTTVFGLMKMIVLLPFQLWRKSAPEPHHNASHLDHAQIGQQWSEIKEVMQFGGPAHFRMAILQADNLFDSVLKDLGQSGNTMGERLQGVQKMLSNETYQLVWQAHKVRNRIAHEVDSEVMSWEARETIARFEHGLRELKALQD